MVKSEDWQKEFEPKYGPDTDHQEKGVMSHVHIRIGLQKLPLTRKIWNQSIMVSSGSYVHVHDRQVIWTNSGIYMVKPLRTGRGPCYACVASRQLDSQHGGQQWLLLWLWRSAKASIERRCNVILIGLVEKVGLKWPVECCLLIDSNTSYEPCSSRQSAKPGVRPNRNICWSPKPTQLYATSWWGLYIT